MDFQTIISPGQLAGSLDSSDLVILDCRFDLKAPDAGRLAWLEGHIPGAVYADLDRDLSGPVGPETGRHPLPDTEAINDRFSAFGIAPGAQVVCYDQASGAIAARAWWLLRWLGHDRVAILDGGYAGWLARGGPERGGEEANERASFRGQPADGRVLTLAELLGAPDGISSLRLLDARENTRFRGEEEPIDTVAGHIPGATSLHFARTLDENGVMKGPDELRSVFLEALQGDLDAPWAVMCGSGVTACQLAVAAAHAGIRAPRLYPGSFSEWIRDPDRPVGTAPG